MAVVEQEEEKNGEALAVASKSADVPAPVEVNELGVQITSLDGMWRFATCIHLSGLAPKGMNIEGLVVAMQMGFEVGLKPMQAIQNIASINGRPSLWGDAAKGLVEASGLCEEFEEYFEGDDIKKDTFRAVCIVKRVGRKPVRQEFSVADAKLADLWSKAGPWRQYPKRMLQMRARGFAIRDAFPDVMKGLCIAEEARDMPEEPRTPKDVTPKDPGLVALENRLVGRQGEESGDTPDPDTGEVSDNEETDQLFPVEERHAAFVDQG